MTITRAHKGMPIRAYRRSSEVIGGHRRSSSEVLIGGHQRRSEVVIGHHRHLASESFVELDHVHIAELEARHGEHLMRQAIRRPQIDEGGNQGGNQGGN